MHPKTQTKNCSKLPPKKGFLLNFFSYTILDQKPPVNADLGVAVGDDKQQKDTATYRRYWPGK